MTGAASIVGALLLLVCCTAVVGDETTTTPATTTVVASSSSLAISDESCIEALANFAWLLVDDCIETFPTFTTGDLDTIVPQFCATTTGNCTIPYMEHLVESILINCEVFPTDEVEELLRDLSLVCLELDGEYCMPKVGDAIAQFLLASGSDFATVDSSDLEAYCDPCVIEFWTTAVEYASSSDLVELYPYVAACMKDGDTWCWLEWQKALTKIENEDYVGAGEIICETMCIDRLAQYLLNFDDDFSLPTDVMCYRDNNGDLCLPVVAQSLDDNDVVSLCGVAAVSDMTSTETEQCLASLNKVMDDTDCCFTSAINYLNSFFSDVFDVEKFLEEQGVTVPDACPVSLEVSGYMDIKNLLLEYAQDEEDLVDWLTSDISVNLGIATNLINVALQQTQKRSSGTSYTVTLAATSDTQADMLTTSFNNMVSQGKFSLYKTCSKTDFDAYEDPTVGLSVSSTSKMTTKSVNSNGCGSDYSPLMLAATLVLTMLLAMF